MTQIDLKNVHPKVIYVPPKLILYGRNGIGKSRFALKTPNPVFLDLDENIYELPCISNKTLGFDIKTFDDVLAFLGTLFNEEHEFKTLVIDSLSSLEKLVTEKVLKESNVSSLASFQYGQGYQKMMPLWEQFLQKLKTLSNNNESNAIKILNQSIANGWQGIFEIKTIENGNKSAKLNGEQRDKELAEWKLFGKNNISKFNPEN